METTQTHIILGSILIVVGVIDALVMPLVLVPRISNPKAAGKLKLALLGGGVVMTGLGIAFLLELIPLGR